MKIDYSGGLYDLDSYALSPEKIVVAGSGETLKNIEYIKTKKLTDNDLNQLLNKKVEIVLPEGIKLKNENTEILLIKK